MRSAGIRDSTAVASMATQATTMLTGDIRNSKENMSDEDGKGIPSWDVVIEWELDTSKVRGELGIEFQDIDRSIVETFEDLERWGHLGKTRSPLV